MSKKVKRLFEGFQPSNYNINLNPDRDTMHISGTVTITGRKIGRPSQRITFHQHGLTITEATITHSAKKNEQHDIPVSRINHQRSADEVRLHSDQLLYPGYYEVIMTFEGDITRPMDGIYPCFFKEGEQEKQLIATQFESHHAREAFPCIDEPEAKAVFNLTLTSPLNESVISNTPVAFQETIADKLVTTFEPTPKMSTYLLAFVYGDLKYLEAKTKDGIIVRTYATPENVQFTDFALDVAVKCLDFYAEYFDIPYPLEKCDFIALPDFASGAMENWGCITFREAGLLLDPANSSLPTKQYIASVVAHELAHQWFGNLVTMRWWNDLWLNEGFATWMSYLASDNLFPDWQVWTQFVVDEQQAALKLDALENTHPIQVEIHHPDEIRTIFDAISYEKGASVLQMLAHYLGPDAYRDGLRHYLKAHMYGNTVTTDLWDSLESVSGKPVRTFMETWISQPGYPIVHATVKGENVYIKQDVFTINPIVQNDSTKAPLWPVPLGGGLSLPDMFDTHEIAGKVGDDEIFKLNHNQTAFYRVAYNNAHLTKLAEAIAAGKLTPVDRLGILSDTFEAAKGGQLGTTDALRLLEAYRDEDNTVVWDIMAGNIASLRGVMNDEELRESMKPYSRKIVAKQLERLGWIAGKDDSYFDLLLRPTILAIAAVSDEPSVVEEALRQFNAMEKPEDIAPDLRAVVYTTAARLGDEKTFDKLAKLHSETTSNEESVTLALALTNFKQPELIQRALDMITTDAVRAQDIMYWIAYIFGNRFARDMSWTWATSHWEWLQQTIGTDLGFNRMPLYVARCYSDADFLPAYKAFFESVSQPSLERSIKQGIEMIEWQSQWRMRELDSIKKFFKAAQN